MTWDVKTIGWVCMMPDPEKPAQWRYGFLRAATVDVIFFGAGQFRVTRWVKGSYLGTWYL